MRHGPCHSKSLNWYAHFICFSFQLFYYNEITIVKVNICMCGHDIKPGTFRDIVSVWGVFTGKKTSSHRAKGSNRYVLFSTECK